MPYGSDTIRIGETPLACAVIGIDGPLTQLVFNTVRQLLSQAPTHEIIQYDRFDAFALNWTRSTVFLINYPNGALIDLIDSRDMTVIYVQEDPVLAMQFQRKAFGLSQIESIRVQTASLVANAAIGRLNPRAIIDRDNTSTVSDMEEIVARLLRISLGNEEDGNAAGSETPKRTRFGARPLRDLAMDVFRAAGAVKPEDEEPENQAWGDVARNVIDPLNMYARGESTRPVVWPGHVFSTPDNVTIVSPGTIEVSGTIRNLVHGPYFYLPPGRYRVEVILEYSESLTGSTFIVEVHGMLKPLITHVTLSPGGYYRGYLEAEHHDCLSEIELLVRGHEINDSGQLTLVEARFFIL